MWKWRKSGEQWEVRLERWVGPDPEGLWGFHWNLLDPQLREVGIWRLLSCSGIPLSCSDYTPVIGTWLGMRLKVNRLYPSCPGKLVISTGLENRLEIGMEGKCGLRVLFPACFSTVKGVIIYAFGELSVHRLWVWKFSLRVETLPNLLESWECWRRLYFGLSPQVIAWGLPFGSLVPVRLKRLFYVYFQMTWGY